MDFFPQAKSVEWFIEDQIFSPSSDLAPPPPSFLSFSIFLCVAAPVEITDGREGGRGGGAKSQDDEKAWSSINQSILSGPIRDLEQNRLLMSSLLKFSKKELDKGPV